MPLYEDQGCWPEGQGCLLKDGSRLLTLQLWPWCVAMSSPKGCDEGHLQWPFWASLAARMRGTRLARGFASRRKGCWTKRGGFLLVKMNMNKIHYNCQVMLFFMCFSFNKCIHTTNTAYKSFTHTHTCAHVCIYTHVSMHMHEHTHTHMHAAHTHKITCLQI